MKTLLEVVEQNDGMIAFRTGIDLAKQPELIPELTIRIAFCMMTRLWGGNETTVLALIRSLALADLSLSTNRKEMIKLMDDNSASLADAVRKTVKAMERSGNGKTYPSFITPPKNMS